MAPQTLICCAQIKKLQAIPKDKKAEIVRILDFILETLRPHWSGYRGFTELEKRVGIMKNILKKDGNPRDRGSTTFILKNKLTKRPMFAD